MTRTYALLNTTFLMFAQPVMADLYPVVTSAHAEHLSAQETKIYIKQALFDVGPCDGCNTPVTPYHGEMMLAHIEYTPWTGYVVSLQHACKFPLGTPYERKTVAELAIELYESRCKNITEYIVDRARLDERSPDPGCVKYLVGFPGVSWTQALPKFSYCMSPPPPPEWCKIETSAVSLDHGIISVSDSEKHVARDVLKVNCTAPTTVRVQLSGTESDTLELGRSGSSRLAVAGFPLGSRVDLPAGESTVSITSTLHNIPVGSWVASGVLVLEQQ